MKRLLHTLTLVLAAVALPLVLSAQNSKQTVNQVTDGIVLTEDVDYIITSETPFETAGSVDIQNTEHAVVIISKIKPSIVLKKWMDHILVNGEKAVDGTNCQVKMYGRGAIIFPYPKDIKPLTCYTEPDFGGESYNDYSEGHSGGFMKTLKDKELNNQIRSFKLKRGYMVTFAIGTAGWGYSRCFIADQADLEVTSLPNVLDKRISSYRIFKWQNAHKAGLASDGRAVANQALNTSWCYDWAQGNASNLPDTEWVPNHIYEDYPSASTCGSVTGSCHMKANNEPRNQNDDRPQDMETILNNWQNLMRTGMRLCSPSSWDGSDYWNGTGFIKEFLDIIDARGWRCDIVDAHCYWPSGNFGHLQNHWWPNMHRPIWISEWIWGASWNSNGAFGEGVTNANILSTTKSILSNLNSMGCVERFAYWNSESKGKIYTDGLTDLGKYYASMDVGLGYNKNYEFIPTNPPMSAPSKLTATVNQKTMQFTITWDDPNGDLSEKITLQCKQPGENAFKTIDDTIQPKEKTSSGGASFTYSYTGDKPGTYFFKVSIKGYNNKTVTSDEASAIIREGSRGNDFIQYGNIAFNDITKEITTTLSTTYDEAPMVITGLMTFKNQNVTTTPLFGRGAIKTNQFTYLGLPWSNQPNAASNITSAETITYLTLPTPTKEGDTALKQVYENYTFGNMQVETGTFQLKGDVEVTFGQSFPEGVTPTVVATVNRAPSATQAVIHRVWDVTNKGFKCSIAYEDATGKSPVLNYTLGYIAVSPGNECIDETNGIYMAAGQSDVDIYGILRSVYFNYTENDTVWAESPYVFGEFQTHNCPTNCILRMNSLSIEDFADAEGNKYSFANGIKVKRIVDLSVKKSSEADVRKTADRMGWIIIYERASGDFYPNANSIRQIGTLSGQLLNVSVNNRIVTVDGYDNFELFTASGGKVAANAPQAPGIYIVRAGGQTAKIIVK